MKVHRGLYGRNREHDHGVGYEAPPDGLPSAIGGVKQCGHTFEEQHYEKPYNKPNTENLTRRYGLVVGWLGRTIENRGDERSGEKGLLVEVQTVRNFWSIRIVGPQLVLHVPHDPDVYQ